MRPPRRMIRYLHMPNFEHLHLAGLHPLNQAIGYANRILESEGGEAVFANSHYYFINFQ